MKELMTMYVKHYLHEVELVLQIIHRPTRSQKSCIHHISNIEQITFITSQKAYKIKAKNKIQKEETKYILESFVRKIFINTCFLSTK